MTGEQVLEAMANLNYLWIVGQYIGIKDGTWGFQGVFDTEGKAIAACRDANYFVAKVILNQSLPHEITEWLEAYYPLVGAT